MSSQQWTSEGTHCEHSESSKNTEIGMGVRRRNKSGSRNRSRSPHRQWPSRKEGSPWQLPTSIWNEMFNVWNTSIAQLGQLSWIFSSLVLSWTCSWTVGKSFVPLAIAKISVGSYILFIPNPKHWKATWKNFDFIPGCYFIILKLNPKRKTVLATKQKID